MRPPPPQVTDDWDLTGQEPAPPPTPAPPPPQKPYDPEPHREKLRGWIALALLGLLALVVLSLLFGFLVNWITAAEIKDVGIILVSPLVTLVGAVTGFYYGSKTR